MTTERSVERSTATLKKILAAAGLKPVSAMAAGDVFFIEFAGEKAARQADAIFTINGFKMKLERLSVRPIAIWMLTGRTTT